ncbi:MAG: ribokinase [Clostridia bacterium]|nr:ribokinase [Clostridia bacterium]
MKKITVIGLGGMSCFLKVDHFHAEGETVKAESIFFEAGGKGYNQAVVAARLGAKVSFIGGVGSDANALFCKSVLEKEGVEPLFCTKPGEDTAYACILTDAEGRNRVTVYRGAAEQINEQDVYGFENEIASSDLLMLQLEVNDCVLKAAFETAKKHGVAVVFNPAPARMIDKKFLTDSYVITPNEQEAKTLFGEDFVAGLRECGIKRAVITLGGDGALVFEDGTVTHVPPVKVDVKDTTGAGDCFNAALAVAITEGKSLVEAAEFASKAAALSVSKEHVIDALPFRSELW